MEEISEKEFILSPRQTERIALEYVKNWYKTKGKELVPPDKGERGFDLKTSDGFSFYEVKGTATGTTEVAFRNLTPLEFKMAQKCWKSNLEYNLIVVLNVGSDKIFHRTLPAEDIIKSAREEKIYRIPLRRREIEKYKP